MAALDHRTLPRALRVPARRPPSRITADSSADAPPLCRRAAVPGAHPRARRPVCPSPPTLISASPATPAPSRRRPPPRRAIAASPSADAPPPCRRAGDASARPPPADVPSSACAVPPLPPPARAITCAVGPRMCARAFAAVLETSAPSGPRPRALRHVTARRRAIIARMPNELSLSGRTPSRYRACDSMYAETARIFADK